MNGKALKCRHPIRRQFHHKGDRLTFQNCFTQYLNTHNRQNNPDKVNQQHHRTLQIIRKERRHEERINCDPRPAAHQRNHQHRRQTIAAVFQNPRGHNRRNRTPKANQHRDKTFAMQTDLVHDPVHHKCRTGHIAGVFENRDPQK